jgi:hypothetical protein
MSRTTPTRLEQHALSLTCQRCHQAPDQWCVTDTWAWAICLHANRTNRAVAAIRAGNVHEIHGNSAT